MNYSEIVRNFKNTPRDIPTAPTTRVAPKWFYVYEKNGNLYVSCGKDHSNICKIQNDRILLEKEFPIMLDLYHRRQRGDSISAESQAASMNQSYWYGIFKELSL